MVKSPIAMNIVEAMRVKRPRVTHAKITVFTASLASAAVFASDANMYLNPHIASETIAIPDAIDISPAIAVDTPAFWDTPCSYASLSVNA